MKYFTLLLTPLFIFAAENTLTPTEHNSIHGYNKRPIVKMQKKQKMHKLHKIDEKDAANITKEELNEELENIKLVHKGNILKYLVETQHYTLEINALNGSIISKNKR